MRMPYSAARMLSETHRLPPTKRVDGDSVNKRETSGEQVLQVIMGQNGWVLQKNISDQRIRRTGNLILTSS